MKGRFVQVLFLVVVMLVMAVGVVSAASPGQVDEVEWFDQFLTASVKGTPIFLVVFVLIEAFKKLQKPDGSPLLGGNSILLLSLFVGLILGIGWVLWQAEPPIDGYAVYQYWFAAVVFGLMMGGGAAVFYDRLKALVENTLHKLLAKYQGPVL